MADPNLVISQRKRKFSIEPYLYLLPALLFFCVFSFYPFARTVVSSFFTITARGQIIEFAGLGNYVRVFEDPNFIRSIGNTAIYIILASPAAIIIALVLAILANKKTRTSSIYETMFALTMAMSTAVSAMIFNTMYSPSIGIINKILMTRINWLNDPGIAMFSLSFITVWMNIGFNFLFLVTAIRNVPDELLESADIEGVNLIQRVRYIILPIISPTVFFLICISLARNIIMAGLPIILTQGGPQGSTSTMIFYMYRQAFGNSNLNYAYAAAVITFIFSLILIQISFLFEKKGVHYQ
jgi:sn-glycerol 3-phosphate transport system permease protein